MFHRFSTNERKGWFRPGSAERVVHPGAEVDGVVIAPEADLGGLGHGLAFAWLDLTEATRCRSGAPDCVVDLAMEVDDPGQARAPTSGGGVGWTLWAESGENRGRATRSRRREFLYSTNLLVDDGNRSTRQRSGRMTRG